MCFVPGFLEGGGWFVGGGVRGWCVGKRGRGEDGLVG